MSNVLNYTLSLQDQITAKLQKIGVTSESALTKFGNLQQQSIKTSQLLKDMGGSVGSLREKLSLLKSEKEWIPQSNLQGIRKYNTEIKNLETEILKLDTINGSAFKRNLKGAISNLPFSELITNPVAQAGVALFQSGKMALGFDEGMAKINTTAQLSSEGVAKLKNDLITMGRDAGADLSTVPDAYEKILSQTNDVALSTDILKTTLKGAKAGFTDLDTVSAAVAQTLSLVGKENTNAQEVMDTLFAAKNVGAGEFKDFAQYVPSLIASGQALGKGYKETAGVFAYMTAKGFAAEKSAMLIENAYTALSKPKVSKNLQKTGVDVFDEKGQMKSMDKIMMSFDKKMKTFGKNDNAKLKYLASVGLDDAQAKAAFFALSSGAKDLKTKMDAVNNSTGASDKAFKDAQNPMMKITKMWSDFQAIAIATGGILSTVLAPVLGALGIIVGGAADMIGWFSQKLQEGNPWIIGFTGVLAALTAAYYANAIATEIAEAWTKRKIITDKLAAFWAQVCTGATTLWAGATWLLNSAILTIPMAIIAIIAIIAYLVYAVDGWGAAWKHTVNGAKLLFKAYIEAVKFYFSTFIDAFMIGLNYIKLGWYSFKEAVGSGSSAENQSEIAKIAADTKAREQAILDGAKKVRDTALKAKEEFALAAGSFHTNGKGFSTMTGDIKKTFGLEDKGIAKPKVPGAIDPTGKPPADGAGVGAGGKTNDAIATGGTKNSVVNITIQEMNGVRANILQGAKEAIDKAGSGLEDAILRTLAMASSAAS